ncbi:TPA: Dot/Icm T4SS effector SidG, partial [Legionella pneumophila]|nr:Dot/Icm T4SS effector SidG [Legionella pneumophila]
MFLPKGGQKMSRSKDEVLEANDSLFGITVQTWGTNDRPSNGMMNFADQQFFGGDVGHASINMKLPVTDKTKQWIEKYCYSQTYDQFKKVKGNEDKTYEEYLKTAKRLIPVELKTQVTRKAQYDSNGNLVTTHEKAYEQIYFDIDWSWWPGRLQNTEDDMVWEREGKHFEYDEKWKEYLQPEQRVHRGKLGSRKMDYAPTSIIHQRDIPTSELEKITRDHKIHTIEEKLNVVKLLQSKIDEMPHTKMSPSMELMFKNLGINVEKLLDETKDNGVDPTNLEAMREYLTNRLTERKLELETELSEAKKEVDSTQVKNKVEDVYYDFEYKLNQVRKKMEEVNSQLEKMDSLLHKLEGNTSGPIPYTAEIDELMSVLPFLKEELELENGTLSPKSIENLIDHIDELKNELASKQEKKNERNLNLIKKYEELCEQYKDDEEGLEEALWEEGIDVEEVNSAKKDISKPAPEIQKLTDLQEQLRNHKESGVKLSSELEETLNSSVKMWKTKIDSPCQVISESSVKALVSKINSTRPELVKEKEQLPEQEESLSKEAKKAQEELIKIQEFSQFYSENSSAYMVIGLPPHHQVSLPLAVNGKRGLHPEAMLKKMHELVAGPEKKEFNLHTNNCSLTSIEVLSAGAQHDPLLHSIMGTRALGFFGTPQQVLENAKLTSKTINEGKKSNIFTPLVTASPLDRALGYAMSIYMDPEASKAKQNAGLALGVLVGLAKTPGIIIGSLLNPKQGFNDILNTLNLVYSRNSTGLKVGLTLMALPAMIVLAPLAAIQKGVEVIAETIAKPFKLIANLFKQKPESTDEITVSVGSKKVAEKEGSYSNTALAGLVNSKIKSKIDENTITVEFQKSPQKMIEEFESQLKENPGKVVVLSEKAHNAVLKFVSKSDDEALKQKFYDCCNQSVARSQKFAPKTRDEIDELVEEVTSTDKTELTTSPRQEPSMSSTIDEEENIDSEHQIETGTES